MLKRTHILFFCLCVTIFAYAQNDYETLIKNYKTNRNILTERGVMHTYSLWARSLIHDGDDIAATKVYEQAVIDTFLSNDYQTVMALELCALYNKRLMHKSAYNLLLQHTFSPEYSNAWRWSLSMAQTQMYMHNYDEALSSLNSVINHLTNPDNNTLCELLANRGYIYLSIGKSELALQDMQQAYSITDDKIVEYKILSNIAITKLALNDKDGALNDINACIEHISNILNNTPEHHRQQLLNDYYIAIRKRAEIELYSNRLPESATDYKYYWLHEKNSIISNFASMPTQQRLDYWANRKPLISEMFALETHCPALLADVAIFRHQTALLGIADTTEQILSNRLAISATDVRSVLNKGETAIEFVKYKQNNEYYYAALVIPHKDDGDIQFIKLFSESTIFNFPIGVTTLRDALCSTSAIDKNRVYSSVSLAETIWAPIKDYIKPQSDIWFAPDGILNLLAIEYLPMTDGMQYRLHRLSSVGLLYEARKSKHTQQQNNTTLVIGGLDYNSLDDYMSEDVSIESLIKQSDSTDLEYRQRGLRYWMEQCGSLPYFGYLPGSRKEVDSITQFIESWERTYFETEELLKQEFNRFQNVHLSTHGYSLQIDIADPEPTMRDSITTDYSLYASGIALSGANIAYLCSSCEDGMLTAREICDLDLSNVDFVVTSSCQSAQGRVSDEGPAGLLRGLKFAGVNTVMATLWPVSDAATTLFMQYFYEEWHSGHGKDGKGCSKAEALQKAQQRLRNYGENTTRKIRRFNAAKMKSEIITQHNVTIYDAPYYWAPFILIDDL